MSGATEGRLLLALAPEISQALLTRLLQPPRSLWRRSWFYRLGPKGPLPDRIACQLSDGLPRRLEEADALFRGRFRFAGQTVEIREGSVFDKPAPSRAWAEALHAFQWLPPLAAAGGEAARTLATNLFSQWLRRHAKYGEPAWLPHVTARRLANTFVHGRLFFTNSDVLWRSRVFVSLREQTRVLARLAHEAPVGLPALEVASVIALAAACLDQDRRRLALGLDLLGQELKKQILPDGGHISRSPSQLLEAYRLLSMVLNALRAASVEVPPDLRGAHDRMAPMLRFFLHQDGGLALFNGSGEGDSRVIANLLADHDVVGEPFFHARHSGYQRLAAAGATVLMDCGVAPPLPFATRAHAGSLSFEFSTRGHRLIVNCGPVEESPSSWEDALCATAAHSTLTLADTSSGMLMPPGWLRDLIGRRLVEGAAPVVSTRDDTPDGFHVHASHAGYEQQFGCRHERYVGLGRDGTALVGEDCLIRGGEHRKSIPFAIRFHIHPDVRLAPAQGGDFLLKLPNGDGWRFRTSGVEAEVEESVYLGDGTIRRSEQLVISGAVRDTPVQVGWAFEQLASPPMPRGSLVAAELSSSS